MNTLVSLGKGILTISRAKKRATSEGDVSAPRGEASEDVDPVASVLGMITQLLLQSKEMNGHFQVPEQQQAHPAGTVGILGEVPGWQRHIASIDRVNGTSHSESIAGWGAVCHRSLREGAGSSVSF